LRSLIGAEDEPVLDPFLAFDDDMHRFPSRRGEEAVRN
jgi:hypothetical protein